MITPTNHQMIDKSNPRQFPFKMATWLPARYASYLLWLSRMLDRLGTDCALAVWREVSQDDDDELLQHILSTGWQSVEQDKPVNIENAITQHLERIFPIPIQGISPEKARHLAEELPPIKQIRRHFPTINAWRLITAYEALHLILDGTARLCETLLRLYGKQGELIAYDLLREERIHAQGGKTGSVTEFISNFSSQPGEANLFTAGLEMEVVPVTEREVIMKIKECEWARYFRERHPQVGYLVACSTDEAAYRAFNPNLRLQRTTTLMEGGKECDFRIYAVDEESAEQ